MYELKTINGFSKIMFNFAGLLRMTEEKFPELGDLIETLYRVIEDEVSHTKITVKIYNTDEDKPPMTMLFITDGKKVGGYKITEGVSVEPLKVITYA